MKKKQLAIMSIEVPVIEQQSQTLPYDDAVASADIKELGFDFKYLAHKIKAQRLGQSPMTPAQFVRSIWKDAGAQ